MSRSALVVLVALLLAGAATGTVLALPSQATDDPITMLTLDSPTTSDRVTQSVDVSRAVGLQREAASSRLEQYAFEERLAGEDEENASRIVADERARLAEQIGQLHSEERALRADYVEGRIDTSTYLRGLIRLETRAAAIESRIAAAAALAEERGLDDAAIADLNGRLVGFSGPVRDRLRAATVGEAPTIRVAVAASANGTELTMIEDGTHVREAYRPDRRTTDTVGEIPPDELFSLVNEFVSDVYELEPRSTNIRRGLGSGVYLAIVEAPRSLPYLTLTTYIDGDTEKIFSEVQERDLDRLPGDRAPRSLRTGPVWSSTAASPAARSGSPRTTTGRARRPPRRSS